MTKEKAKNPGAVAVAPGRKPTVLLSDLRELILSTRQQVAQTVNAGLTMLYWHIGAAYPPGHPEGKAG